MTVGENLRKVRAVKGYSQEYMARELGMSQNNYSELERGKIQLTVERLTKIATLLEVKPNELLNLDENFSFKNKNHKGGNQILINMFPDKMIENYEERIKDLQSQNKHLKGEIEFLRKLTEKK